MELRRLVALVSLAAALPLTGCSDELPVRLPVAGRVTIAGQPVTDGRIVFYPENGRPAMAAIGEDGRYRLTTFDDGDGALPGQHRVTIEATRIVDTSGARSIEEELAGVPINYNAATEWIVPEVYSQQETTPLSAEVTEATDALDFDLPAGPP